MKASRLLKYIMDVEVILYKSCFFGDFWSFFEGISHNPDKIALFLGYQAYPDKNDQNRPKNNSDIGAYLLGSFRGYTVWRPGRAGKKAIFAGQSGRARADPDPSILPTYKTILSTTSICN